MSTAARDKARDEYVASTGWTMSEAAAIADGYDAGFDAGRASVLSALTEERIAETIYTAEKHAEYGDQWTETWDEESGSYQEPYRASARAVLALIEQETTK